MRSSRPCWHLAAERAHYDWQMAPLAGLKDQLLAELTSRTPAAAQSATKSKS